MDEQMKAEVIQLMSEVLATHEANHTPTEPAPAQEEPDINELWRQYLDAHC